MGKSASFKGPGSISHRKGEMVDLRASELSIWDVLVWGV